MSRKEAKPRSPRTRKRESDAEDHSSNQPADNGSDDADRQVGYGRPPLHSRFKPGQSGNPKGRPKRMRSLEEMVGEELRKQRKVTVRGKTVRMPVLKIMLASMAERAMRGDTAAFRALTPVMVRSLGTVEDGEALAAMPEEDRQLLASYVEKIAGEMKRSDERGGS